MGQLQGSQLAAFQDRQLTNQGVEGAFSGLTSMGESIAKNQALYKAQPKVANVVAPTVKEATSPFQTPTSALLKTTGTPMLNTYGPMPEMGMAPQGTNVFGNASYAPGYTPYEIGRAHV